MGASQERQRPRSRTQETSGTLSRDRMGAPQLGHRERGRTIDSPRGTRWTATVRKLPKTSPNGSASRMRSATSKVVIVAGRTLPQAARTPLPYATSRRYTMFWSNPAKAGTPGTRTGLYDIVKEFARLTVLASTCPVKLFRLLMATVHGL